MVFEKETAAKTALLLDNTQLGSTQVQVSSAAGLSADEGNHFTANADRDTDEITQEEKPRSRIIAEYLAHGYVCYVLSSPHDLLLNFSQLIGDQATQRAIDLDQKHGVSNKFLQTLQNLDQKYHACIPQYPVLFEP